MTELINNGVMNGMNKDTATVNSNIGRNPIRKQRSQRFVVPTSLDPLLAQSIVPPVPNLPPYNTSSSSSSSNPTTSSISSSNTSSGEDPFFSFGRVLPHQSSSNTISKRSMGHQMEESIGSTSTSNSNPNPYSYSNTYPNPFTNPSTSSFPASPFATFPSSHSSNPYSSSSNPYATISVPAYRRGTIPFDNSSAGIVTAASTNGLPNEWINKAPGVGLNSDYGNVNLNGKGMTRREDEDVIPTAIVIKNIHFSLPKEALLKIMEDLNLPPPFAFNYHFDNGQFRGLAFANYRLSEEAALTVAGLNGFDLQGRRLRAEFKKVLKEGEKERIERDKAIKRMRSQRDLSSPPITSSSSISTQNQNQLNSNRIIPQSQGSNQYLYAQTHLDSNNGPPIGTWNRREASAPGQFGGNGSSFDLTKQQEEEVEEEEEDYGRLIQGQFSGFNLVGGNGVGNVKMGDGFSHASDVGTSISARMTKSISSTTSGGGGGGASGSHVSSLSASDRSRPELDLNDPLALEIYSRVLIFKDDSLRDELSFARSLNQAQRRNVHLVARKLGLEHSSIGEGDDRHVVVFKGGKGIKVGEKKVEVVQQARPLRHSSSTLGRQTSQGLASNYIRPDSNYSNNSYVSSNGVRGKKSMPDLRNLNGNYQRSNYSHYPPPPSLPHLIQHYLPQNFGYGNQHQPQQGGFGSNQSYSQQSPPPPPPPPSMQTYSQPQFQSQMHTSPSIQSFNTIRQPPAFVQELFHHSNTNSNQLQPLPLPQHPTLHSQAPPLLQAQSQLIPPSATLLPPSSSFSNLPTSTSTSTFPSLSPPLPPPGLTTSSSYNYSNPQQFQPQGYQHRKHQSADFTSTISNSTSDGNLGLAMRQPRGPDLLMKGFGVVG